MGCESKTGIIRGRKYPVKKIRRMKTRLRGTKII